MPCLGYAIPVRMLRSKLARPTRGSAATGRRALRNWAGGREDVRFQFKCTQCGKCCTGRGGRVRVNERELARIASATGESIAAVQRKFVRRGPEPGQWLLRQTDDDSRCVFLDGTKCSIYKGSSKGTLCALRTARLTVCRSIRQRVQRSARRTRGGRRT